MKREGNVTRIGGEIRRRQHFYAELKALGAEERQIDAEIIDLEPWRAERQARQAAKGQVDEIRPDHSRDAAYRQHIPGYDPPQSGTMTNRPVTTAGRAGGLTTITTATATTITAEGASESGSTRAVTDTARGSKKGPNGGRLRRAWHKLAGWILRRRRGIPQSPELWKSSRRLDRRHAVRARVKLN